MVTAMTLKMHRRTVTRLCVSFSPFRSPRGRLFPLHRCAHRPVASGTEERPVGLAALRWGWGFAALEPVKAENVKLKTKR